MRTKYATINAIFGIAFQVTNALINFVIRRVLVSSVGLDYLGVNGLFSNILQLLSLVESGFGVAIIYLLYKPIASNDEMQIAKYMNYYRKIYHIVAVVIFILGIAMIPFLKVIVKDNPFGDRDIIVFYLLFLANTVSSYFLAYKASFLNACQRQYYVSVISIIANVIFAGLKIFSLIVLKNYILYLAIIIINTVAINLIVSEVVNHKFAYLRKYKKLELDKDIQNKIKNDVKAVMYHKVGGYVLNGTDNIVITYFVGLASVGLYSNYYLIMSTVGLFLSQVFTAIVPGFGEIIAEDSVRKTNHIYDVFKTVYFLDFLLYGLCSCIMVGLMQPFMVLWLGNTEYKLDDLIMFLVVFNFYLGGMRQAPVSVKSAAGIFKQDRFSPVLEAIINIIVSVVLASKIGIAGVIIGTITSCICMPFWTGPYFVYRDLFHRNFGKYLLVSLQYMGVTAVGCFLCYKISGLFNYSGGVVRFILLSVTCVIVAIIYFLVVFLCSRERNKLMEHVRPIFKKLKNIKN